MKLAAIYNLWDGEELLEAAIDSIRADVDFVIVLWQTVSYHREHYDASPTVERLISSKRIDLAHLFHPSPNLPGQANETAKRTLGIDLARQHNCTHFVLLDCDELYLPNSFKWAKDQIIEHDFDGSACQLRTFFKRPTYQIMPPEEHWVPFIHRLKSDTHIADTYPVFVDPTKRIAPIDRFRAFTRNELEQYHYSWVRKDIGKKMRGMSVQVVPSHMVEMGIQLFNIYEPQYVPLIYKGRRVEIVPDPFNLESRYGL